jgi:hypothetical protein
MSSEMVVREAFALSFRVRSRGCGDPPEGIGLKSEGIGIKTVNTLAAMQLKQGEANIFEIAGHLVEPDALRAARELSAPCNLPVAESGKINRGQRGASLNSYSPRAAGVSKYPFTSPVAEPGENSA